MGIGLMFYGVGEPLTHYLAPPPASGAAPAPATRPAPPSTTPFITSADSASLVMGSLTSRGSLHPPTWLVVTWGVLMAAVAAVLLVAGGLKSLQTATILVALPFVVVMLLLCWALLRELREDPGAGPSRHPALHGLRDAVRATVGEAVEEAGQGRHLRPRRAAAARGRDRGDGPDPHG